jgi:hypothetical protein
LFTAPEPLLTCNDAFVSGVSCQAGSRDQNPQVRQESKAMPKRTSIPRPKYRKRAQMDSWDARPGETRPDGERIREELRQAAEDIEETLKEMHG